CSVLLSWVFYSSLAHCLRHFLIAVFDSAHLFLFPPARHQGVDLGQGLATLLCQVFAGKPRRKLLKDRIPIKPASLGSCPLARRPGSSCSVLSGWLLQEALPAGRFGLERS